MADKTVTVRPSGGTYTTLAAAITGEVTANANLTASGMNGILTISIEGTWSSADTTEVAVTGFTVDSTHYVNIVADSANRAGTAWSTSKYRLVVNGYGYCLGISNNYTHVTGLQVQKTQLNPAIYIEGSAQILNSVLVKTSLQHGILISGGDSPNQHKLINCVVIGNDNNYDGIRTSGVNGTAYFYNCATINCGGYGFNLAQYRESVLINCYAGGSGTADYTDNAGGLCTFTDCYSSDGSESTSTAAYSTDTFTNVTAGSEDFSIVTGSDLIGAGTDLSADATYPFDWDITGATRVTWDVGAAYFADAVTSYSCIGAGTFTFGGSSISNVSLSYTGSGTLTFGGDAISNVALSCIGSGTLSFAGSADASLNADKSYDGSGTFTLSGAATTSVVESYVGYGTLTFGGSAETSYVSSQKYIGSGTFTLSGSAAVTVDYNYTGSGTLELSGEAVVTESMAYTGTGTLSFGGAAVCYIQGTTFGMITIGESWVPCTECQMVISGTWHTVSEIQVVMGETWRSLV